MSISLSGRSLRVRADHATHVQRWTGPYADKWASFIQTLQGLGDTFDYGQAVIAARLAFPWHGYPGRVIRKAIEWGAIAIIDRRSTVHIKHTPIATCITCKAPREDEAFQECKSCIEKRLVALRMEAA